MKIINDVHTRCIEHGVSEDIVNFVDGADIAGFKKGADALSAYGVV